MRFFGFLPTNLHHAYEAIFGEVTEDESKIQVCYSLSVGTTEKIKRLAAEAGISASAYIDRLVQERIAE